MMQRDGYVLFAHDPRVLAWAQAAKKVAAEIAADPAKQRDNLRHRDTWFVGVDALPNDRDGAIDGVPLSGPWVGHVPDLPQHAAQLSIIYPGYPRRDPDQSAASHRYRMERCAAHVDGLLPEGPARRRHLREPHGFIAGLPLNDVAASPLVVWEGSHRIMRAAFQGVYSGLPADAWGDVDVTDVYQAARKDCFARCKRTEIHAKPGEVILLDRHLLHGVAPWGDTPGDMRMIAYFRPQIAVADWL